MEENNMHFTYNFESFGVFVSTLKDRFDPKEYNFLTNDTLPTQGKLLLIDEAKNMTIDPLITFINEFSKGYDSGIRIKHIYSIIKDTKPQYLHCTPYNGRFCPALEYFKDLKSVDLLTLAGKVVIDSIPSGKIPVVTNYGESLVPDVHYSDIKDFLKDTRFEYISDTWSYRSTIPFYLLGKL